MNKIKLRPYQQEAKDNIYKAFKDRGITKQLIVMATGLGKRILAVDIACHFKKILFICHKKELITQAFKEFEKLFPLQCGIIKAERFEIDKRFTIASAQTLYNRLNKIKPDTFDHIIVDEAHHFLAKSYLAPLHYFKPRLMLGYTATPRRFDGLNLSNLFEEITFKMGIEEGVTQNYLAKPEAYRIETQIDLSKIHKVAGDFNQKELSNKVNIPARNHFIVQKWEEITHKEPTIAYCIDIQHCIDLKETFEQHGYNPAIIVSKKSITPDREGTLKKFINGEVNPLINCEILTEGLDISDIGCILHCRPTMSETLYVQITGRGLRLKFDDFFQRYGHRTCFVLDFVDNCGKHSLISSYSLEKDKPLADRIFINTAEKEKKLKEIADRKGRDSKIDNMFTDTRKVNLLKLPEVSISSSIRMEEPATTGQIDWLKRLGVYDENVEYTKKQASEFITFSQASQWQIRWMAKHNYDISNGVTMGQYQKIKRLIEGREERKNNVFIPSDDRLTF